MIVPGVGGATLPDWLARRAAISAQQPALIAADLRWTFAELDQQASGVAAALASRGIRTGDRIALLVGNRPEFVAVVHGAPRLGAVLVPLNLRLAAPELAWQLADVGARFLLHDSARAPLADALQAAVPGLQVLPVDQLSGGRGTGDGGQGTEREPPHPPPLSRRSGEGVVPPLSRATGEGEGEGFPSFPSPVPRPPRSCTRSSTPPGRPAARRA